MDRFFEVTTSREEKPEDFGNNHVIIQADDVADCVKRLSSMSEMKHKNYNELSATNIKEIFYVRLKGPKK